MTKVASMDKDAAALARSRALRMANGGRVNPTPKGPDRLAIEAVLAAAGCTAQTARVVAAATGLAEDRVSRVLRDMRSKGVARSMDVGAGVGYVLAERQRMVTPADRPVPHVNSTTAERNWCPPWLKTSSINHSARPGAQDAFHLPSRVGNQLEHPRRHGCRA